MLSNPVEELYDRRASLLLSVVRAAIVAGTQGPVPQVLQELAHRLGVAPAVERRALEAWREEERKAKPARAADPTRLQVLALSRASVRLRAAWRRAA